MQIFQDQRGSRYEGAPKHRGAGQDSVSSWSSDGLQDYEGVRAKLPVLEESVTQLGAGTFSAGAAIVSAGDVVLYRARPNVVSIGVTVLDPAYVAFAIPISWEGEYLINGQTGKASSLYPPSAEGIVYIRGGRRDTLGVIMLRSMLIDTVAALRGVSQDEVVLDDRPHELNAAGAVSLRRSLLAMLDAYCGRAEQTAARGGPEEFADEVFGLIADAYLCTRPGEKRRIGGSQRLAPIVRRAEERFLDAAGEPVSLADLCAAAGVGKSKLYQAFGHICGVPPLEYFSKRRLMRARSILISTPPLARGGVKRAALDVGFTELGRFSVEYRRLFGESPSTTLNAR